MFFVEADSGKSSVWKFRLFVATALIAAAAVYWNGLSGGFVYDDRFLVVERSNIRDLSPAGIARIFEYLSDKHYLPVRSLSYAIDYRLWGLNPFRFHAVNLALHLLNVVLAACIIRAVLETGGGRLRGTAWAAAGAAAALFAAHPLNVESVTWITGRKDVLSTAFVLCSTLLYLKSYRRPRKDGTDWTIAAAFALYGLALLTKATVVAFPLALLATEILIPPGEGQGALRARLERLAPFFVMDFVVLVVDVNLSAKTNIIVGPFGGTIYRHFLTISTIPLLYLQKLFWPAKLCIEYMTRPEKSILSPRVIASLLLWAGVLVWFIFRARQRRQVAWLAAWAVLNMAPVMNLLPTTKLIADRYAYLPAIGFFGLAGCVFARAAASPGAARRTAAWALLAAAVAGFGARTVLRNRDWHSDLALWQAAVRVEPEKPIVIHNLGFAYYEAKDYLMAAYYFNKALEREPEYVSALVNLAAMEYEVWGKTDAATAHLRRALELDPGNARARANLAIALFNKREYEAAIREMMRAIESDPVDLSLETKFSSMYHSLEKRGMKMDIPQTFLMRLRIRP